jgi:hypothetical protein
MSSPYRQLPLKNLKKPIFLHGSSSYMREGNGGKLAHAMHCQGKEQAMHCQGKEQTMHCQGKEQAMQCQGKEQAMQCQLRPNHKVK